MGGIPYPTGHLLTYGQPATYKIYLLTMPVTMLKNFGIKKNIDMVAHWALLIDGRCYQLVRTRDKAKPYAYQSTSEPEFVDHRNEQKKPIVYMEVGYMAAAYSHEIIDKVASLVWERSLKKKYAYDENNCQMFIRLLVELIGNQHTKVQFPVCLDQMVKGAGNTRDGGILALATGMTLMAAGATFMGADGGATAAAGFALAAGTTLRSTTWLLTERDNRAKKIKEGQKDIREQMAKDRTPLL